jgi:predicted transcriptional regulator
MSPRAAWRLEAFGYSEVYDYVPGKADWMAAGLPTDGDGGHRSRVLDVMDRSAPTCQPDERVADVVARIGLTGAPLCVVVNDGGVVQGRLRPDRVDATGVRPVEEVMEPGPATIRADADLNETIERMKRRGVASLIVSTPEGVMLGVVRVEADDDVSP